MFENWNFTFIYLFFFFKMVSAWYMDDLDQDSDQRLEHHKNPSQPVDMKDVNTLTGVLHWKVY